jgi:hypothetical protein
MKDVLEINVPSSLESVTLKQYQKWVELVEALGDNPDEVFLNKALVRIFCGVPNKEIENIDFMEFDKILEVLRGAFEEKHETLVQRFTMNGIEYGFEPNIERMSTGVYIDVESSLEWGDFHVAMDALYRPIAFNRKAYGIDQYAIMPYEPCEKKAELMKQAPLSVAMSARVFFCNLSRDLLNTSLIYLEEQMKNHKDFSQQKQHLQKEMDGIIQYMHSQEGLSRNLTQLNQSQYLER